VVNRNYNHSTICGIDKRPFFPCVLLVSLLWSMSMLGLQSMVVSSIFGSSRRCVLFFLSLYSTTIWAAMYTSLADPGLMNEEHHQKWRAGQTSMPRRAHKHWLYRRPVLRFHQYCRWVTNCVGLRNHRSYMIMLAGFVTIAVLDAFLDFILVLVHWRGGSWTVELLLLLHLAYSSYFAWYSVPLLRQHAGFLIRNELTQEWKRDDFNIVYCKATGEKITVNELDTEEYNRRFDEFEYDPSRNPFDKGWWRNLLNFWIAPRGDPEEWGEF